MDDRQLVQQLLAGNEEAEHLFFHSYRNRLYRACVSLLGYQDPEAEDVTQEAFLIALRKLREFEFRSTLFSWLYGICVNLCYDRMDKRQRQVSLLDEELENLAAPLAEDRQRKAEEEAEKARLLQILEAQKNRLGTFCRELLEMRDGRGLSYAQLSQALKVPMGTVMSRLSRCKEALKRLALESLEGGKDG